MCGVQCAVCSVQWVEPDAWEQGLVGASVRRSLYSVVVAFGLSYDVFSVVGI